MLFRPSARTGVIFVGAGLLLGFFLDAPAYASSPAPFGVQARMAEQQDRHVDAVLGPRPAAQASSPQLHWGWANPHPSGDLFEAVAYGNGVYVAAGTGGVLYSSTDGSHWTARQGFQSTGFSYFDVYYAAGQFLAGGTDAALATHITTSPDGVTWTDHVQKLASGQLADHIGYGNGTYLAVNSVALTSSDGITWHEHSIESASNHPIFDSPYYANGVFVAAGNDSTANNVLYYSNDGGVVWHHSVTNIPNTDFMLSLSSNGHDFVFTGIDETFSSAQAGVVYTSTDGKTWTRQALAGGGDGFFYPTLWDGSHYVSLSSDSGQAHIYTSTDGVSWAQGAAATLGNFAGSHHPIVWTGNGYVGTGIESLQLQSSHDDAIWKTAFSGATGPSDDLAVAAYLNGHYLAAGSPSSGETQSIFESTDGLKWKQVLTSNKAGPIAALAYGKGVYVAAGYVASTYYSTDAKSWSPMLTPPGIDLFGMAFGNGKFVGVGSLCTSCAPIVTTSSDGKTWTTQNLSSVTSDTLMSVAYTGTRFVAVTDDSSNDDVYVLTSPDGITWTPGSFAPPTGTAFTRVQWDGDRLVAVGGAPNGVFVAGYVAVSKDGLSWSGASNDEPGISFVDAFYDGTRYYVAANSPGTVYTSSDAKSWTFMDGVPADAHINSFAYNAGRYVTAGSQGNLLVAEATAPVASDGSVSTVSGQPVTGSFKASAASGAALTFKLVSDPSHGTVKVLDAAAGTFRYTPDSGYTGNDSLSFAADDGIASSDPATESVTVTAASSGGGGGGESFGLLLIAGLLRLAALRRR